jgi:hypothetical protein
MGELEWLNGYSGQGTAELLTLEGTFRTDSLVLAFEEAISQKAARIGADGLTTAELTVLAVEALEREVNSDGYLGLFTNAPEQVPHVVASLEAIGRADVAQHTRRAIAALAIEGPLTEEAIAAAVGGEDDDRDEALSECDGLYYESAGDLADPLLSFIKSHADQIRIP